MITAKRKEYLKNYYENNKEKVAKVADKWRKNNKEKVRFNSRRRQYKRKYGTEIAEIKLLIYVLKKKANGIDLTSLLKTA